MQQFFLLCTMLNVASEAFSKELHGNQVSASVKRKFSRFAPKREYPNSHRYMFDDLNFPMFFVPSSLEVPDCGASFVFPLRRRVRKRRRVGQNSFLRKRENFSSTKRFKYKLLKKRKRNSPWPLDVAHSYVSNSPQYFANHRLPGSELPFEPRQYVNSAFGDYDSRQSVTVRYPSQYIICVYPVFNDPKFRSKKRTLGIVKKRKFSALKGQYLTNIQSKRSKNKRSANTTTTTDAAASKKNTQEVTSENHFENPVTPDPNLLTPPDIDYPYDSLDIQAPNPYLSPLLTRPSYHSKFPFLPLPNVYTSYLDATRPAVSLPKINFKFPYDPKVYEPYLRSDASLLPNPKTKETSELEEKTEDNPEVSAAPNLEKLKQMLEEVETVLKDEKDTAPLKDSTDNTCKGKDKCGDKKTKKKKKKKSKDETEITQESLKEKIDSVAIPILSQISQALGKLSQASSSDSSPSNATTEVQSSKSNQKSSSDRCSPDGTWTSSVLGMEMTFTTMPNMMLKVKITNKKDAIINSKWSIHGLTLSKRGGPLMLAAVYPQKRKLASFIGQCKMCRNQDLIFGSWTIYTCVRRFSDLWRAVDTKLDILKKESGKA